MAEQSPSGIQPVDTLLESTLDSVDTAEATTLAMAEKLGFDEDDLHKIGMAVREAMVNAVVHGNRYSARKKVHFSVSPAGGALTIEIGDEGEGFDRAKLPDPLAEENLLRHSGRGLLLIEAFMDECSVRQRTPNGTAVRMVKRIASASGS